MQLRTQEAISLFKSITTAKSDYTLSTENETNNEHYKVTARRGKDVPTCRRAMWTIVTGRDGIGVSIENVKQGEEECAEQIRYETASKNN